MLSYITLGRRLLTSIYFLCKIAFNDISVNWGRAGPNENKVLAVAYGLVRIGAAIRGLAILAF